ncbi:hypothetical protein GE061_007425 [Apolygus lucorum]|uniref:Uncharacterized protein n=1 Tax=Apolygus lucorum TaxID=248454 RepID=A0A8S9WT76_APOLU|nr:hypothetical protein GE061_007425 [Apolygus lucorum]
MYTTPDSQLSTRNVDWIKYKEILEAATDTQVPLKTTKDVDAATAKLMRLIQFAAAEASLRRTSENPLTASRRPPPPHIYHLLLVKRSAKTLWNLTRFLAHKTALNRANKELTLALIEEKQELTKRELAVLNSSDGTLFKKTKQLTKECSDIPPIKLNSIWYSTPTEKTELFSRILEQQFTPNDLPSPIEDELPPPAKQDREKLG